VEIRRVKRTDGGKAPHIGVIVALCASLAVGVSTHGPLAASLLAGITVSVLAVVFHGAPWLYRRKARCRLNDPMLLLAAQATWNAERGSVTIYPDRVVFGPRESAAVRTYAKDSFVRADIDTVRGLVSAARVTLVRAHGHSADVTIMAPVAQVIAALST
jgi:hypothetical protein